jgi:hypothetical protein
MSQPALTEAEIKEREERFRYTDKTHPLIQVLLKLQLPKNPTAESKQ